MKLAPVPRALAIAGVSLAVLLLVMSARAVLEARAAWAEAGLALHAGELELAIARLRTAARWYTPFNTYADRALGRLEQLARAAEASGDRERALMVYRSIHGAIQATRSFYTPHQRELARADERIASLMAEQAPAPIEQSRSKEQRKADYLALLAARDPSSFGVLLAFAGLLAWVGGAVVFLSWGVDSEGRVLRRVAQRSLLSLLLGWIAFAIGLRIA